MAILNDLLVKGISRFIGSVTADEIRGLGANYYGVCDTAAATAAKVVTCEGFVLKAGARISVRFTNGSTSSAAMSLNVNGTGAKNCGVYQYNGTWQTYASRCEKNEVLEFMYDGTYWVTLTPYRLRNLGNYSARLTSANVSLPNGGLQYFLATTAMVTGKPPVDAHILNFNWDNGTTYAAQLAVAHGSVAGCLWTRGQIGTAATWTDWKEIPRLSSPLTNGQIVISDESNGNALLKGVTYDYKLTLSTTFADIDTNTISFSLTNDELTGLNDYISNAVSGGYTGMIHVNFTAPLPGSNTQQTVYIAHSALLDEPDMKWVFSGTTYDSIDKTTYPFTFSYPIASTGPVTATVKLNRASGGGGGVAPVEDTDVFLSRAVNFGENKYKFPSLVGGTVAWNQLFKPRTTNFTINGVNITVSDGKFTASGTATANGGRNVLWNDTDTNIEFIQNHKYFVTTPAPLQVTNHASASSVVNVFYGGSKIYNWTGASVVCHLGWNSTNGTTYSWSGYVWIVDLTLALGPTIADYIYSLEQATTGAGVNWFKQYFPKSYYPYNAGALISVNPTGAETVSADSNESHSYPISPVELRGILKLDANNKLYCDGDIRAIDGTVTRKYGIVDMGTLTYAIGATSESGVYRMQTTDLASLIKPPSGSGVVANIVCAKYPTMSLDAVYTKNIAIGVSAAGSFAVYDPNYNTSSSPSAFKTAMSGVYLVYELATPTTESSAALPVPQVVYDGGIESYIDERDVQVPVGQDATYMDATSAIGKLMDSGLVPSGGSGGGSSESEGTFTVTDGVGSSDTWSYYKIGKQVTVSGKYTGSSTALSLKGLPFAVKFKQVFFLPVQVTSPTIQLYSCQVTLTANATTIGTYGYGSSTTSSWLSFAKTAGTQITFSYITNE